jgi:hypothetical protein
VAHFEMFGPEQSKYTPQPCAKTRLLGVIFTERKNTSRARGESVARAQIVYLNTAQHVGITDKSCIFKMFKLQQVNQKGTLVLLVSRRFPALGKPLHCHTWTPS